MHWLPLAFLSSITAALVAIMTRSSDRAELVVNRVIGFWQS
jgi:hypothetical protein